MKRLADKIVRYLIKRYSLDYYDEKQFEFAISDQGRAWKSLYEERRRLEKESLYTASKVFPNKKETEVTPSQEVSLKKR